MADALASSLRTGPDHMVSPSVASRLGGFGIAPLIAALSPLLVLPVLARVLETSEWASLAIGQSVGGLTALLLGMGWTVTGPAEIARADEAQRRYLLAESFWSRSAGAPVFLLLGSGAVLLIPSVTHDSLAVLAACAAAGQGFSLAWYAIGSGRSGLIISYEALPRLAGSVAGAGAVVTTGVALLFPIALLASMVLPWWVFWRRAFAHEQSVSRQQVISRMRRNAAAVVTEALAGAYSVGASAIVGVTASAASVATFNAGERLTRFGSQAITVAGAAMQGWVAEATGRPFVRRAVASLLSQAAIGTVGFLVLSFAGPEATGFLLGNRLSIDDDTGFALGVFFLLWALETVTGRHVLASRGHTRALLLTTLTGSLVGIVAIHYGAASAGASGAATGLAAGLAVIVMLQTVIVVRLLSREWRHPTDDSNHPKVR